MALVIDELVTELALDPSKHNAGTKQVLDNEKKIRDTSARSSKELETQNKRSADSFLKLTRSAVGFVTVLAGANGLKSMVEQMITGAAATGRLAANLGTSTKELSGWQYALQSVGGTAAEADAAFRSMATAISNFKLTGESGNDSIFAALGIRQNDFTNPQELLLKLSDASQRMSRTRFFNLASQLGLSEGTINLLIKGRARVSDLVKEGETLSGASEKNARAAQAFEAAWAKLTTSIKGSAQPWVEKLATAVGSLSGNTEQMKLFGDIALGAIAAVGIAAGIAYGPVVVLGTAIAGVLRLRQLLNDATPKQRKAWEDDARAGYKEFMAKLAGGDLRGAFEVFKSQAAKGWDIMAGNAAGTTTVGARDGNPARAGRGQRAVALDGNNPGGLNDGSFARSQPGYVGNNGRYAAFATMQDGLNAQKALLRSYVARGYDTPAKIAARWAPAGDGGNDPTAYARSIANKMGIGVNDKISSGAIESFAQAQARTENTKFGKINGAGVNGGGAAGLRSRLNAAGVSSTTNVNGDIIINTAATDAKGIARDIKSELKGRTVTAQANVGLQ